MFVEKDFAHAVNAPYPPCTISENLYVYSTLIKWASGLSTLGSKVCCVRASVHVCAVANKNLNSTDKTVTNVHLAGEKRS